VSRVLRILSVALITAGVVVVCDVAVTLAWKEPISSLYGALRQAAAADDFEALEGSFPAVSGPTQAELRRDANRLARRLGDEIGTGEGFARIRIPAIGVDYAVVEGTDEGPLQRGPGHYPSTGLPGQRRTTAIAGHRTTYLAPFRELDELEGGDEVIVETPYADFIYLVERAEVVAPDRTDIVRDRGRDRLVLTACHPLYSDAERYAVFAELDLVTEPDAE
jgi:sortase A